MMRSNSEPKSPPGTGGKRHSNVRAAVYHMNFRLSQSRSRVWLIPWFCAAVQKWNSNPVAGNSTSDKLKIKCVPLTSPPHTDQPFSRGGTGRPTSDWTQTCLSVCTRTLKRQPNSDPRVLIVFCSTTIVHDCLRLSSAQLQECHIFTSQSQSHLPTVTLVVKGASLCIERVSRSYHSSHNTREHGATHQRHQHLLIKKINCLQFVPSSRLWPWTKLLEVLKIIMRRLKVLPKGPHVNECKDSPNSR